MKNKKSLLSLGLVALVLVLGVGYAVVNEVLLTFTGTATVGEANINVYIDSVTGQEDNILILLYSDNGVLTKQNNKKLFADNINTTI